MLPSHGGSHWFDPSTAHHFPLPDVAVLNPARAPATARKHHQRKAAAMSEPIYIPLHIPPERLEQPALWFAFQRSSILVIDPASAALPQCTGCASPGSTTPAWVASRRVQM